MNFEEIDDCAGLLADEPIHQDEVAATILYLSALAETYAKGNPSSIFQFNFKDLPQECDEECARRIHESVIGFIDQCPWHFHAPSCFTILWHLSVIDLETYYVDKLELYLRMGNADGVWSVCQAIDLGTDLEVFLDEHGNWMSSRSSSEFEINFGVARRFLERYQRNS